LIDNLAGIFSVKA